MDGYIITPDSDDAALCFGKEGVRHVAQLSTGEGFVAFDGPIPFEGGMILEAIGEVGFAPKIRRHTPFGGDGLVLSLVTSDVFRWLEPTMIQQATLVGAGLVLTLTKNPIVTSIWDARIVSYQDVRTELVTA